MFRAVDYGNPKPKVYKPVRVVISPCGSAEPGVEEWSMTVEPVEMRGHVDGPFRLSRWLDLLGKAQRIGALCGGWIFVVDRQRRPFIVKQWIREGSYHFEQEENPEEFRNAVD